VVRADIPRTDSVVCAATNRLPRPQGECHALSASWPSDLTRPILGYRILSQARVKVALQMGAACEKAAIEMSGMRPEMTSDLDRPVRRVVECSRDSTVRSEPVRTFAWAIVNT
jgi:hypothetical protein